MSQTSMERILGKAMLDEEFRIALFSAPDKTLAGFRLNPSEKTRIKRLDNETLELLAQILNARLDKKSNAYLTSVTRLGANISQTRKGTIE